MDPWSDAAAESYLQLGKTLFADPKRREDAIAVWVEGVTKFPTKSAKLWESLAKGYWDTGGFYLAARSCVMVGEISGSKGTEFREIYEKSQLRFSDQVQRDLNPDSEDEGRGRPGEKGFPGLHDRGWEASHHRGKRWSRRRTPGRRHEPSRHHQGVER